jgi:signal transduction histidine kinase
MENDTILIGKDGREVPVGDSAAPIFDASGNVAGAIVVFRDVSKEKELERAKDEFFSIASHELRTPLTAIRGNAAMLEEYFGSKLKDPTIREMIQDIRKAGARLIELVNDFLDTGRLEQGRLKFQKEQFDIAALMEEATRELEPSALGETVSLDIKHPTAPLPQVTADRNRVKQVLINLIGNAFKFTKKGRIVVAAGQEGNTVKVTVSDTGHGIPQENQKLLFKKFQQAPITNSYTRDVTKGTGLGLYISKLMVEGMGGKIWLERSEVGKGSTFAFSLPVADQFSGREPTKTLAKSKKPALR